MVQVPWQTVEHLKNLAPSIDLSQFSFADDEEKYCDIKLHVLENNLDEHQTDNK